MGANKLGWPLFGFCSLVQDLQQNCHHDHNHSGRVAQDTRTFDEFCACARPPWFGRLQPPRGGRPLGQLQLIASQLIRGGGAWKVEIIGTEETRGLVVAARVLEQVGVPTN